MGPRTRNGISRGLERHCSSGPIKLGIFDTLLDLCLCSHTVSDYHPLILDGFIEIEILVSVFGFIEYYSS